MIFARASSLKSSTVRHKRDLGTVVAVLLETRHRTPSALALPGSNDCGVSCRRRALGTTPQRKHWSPPGVF